jgi:hypothetical protein
MAQRQPRGNITAEDLFKIELLRSRGGGCFSRTHNDRAAQEWGEKEGESQTFWKKQDTHFIPITFSAATDTPANTTF